MDRTELDPIERYETVTDDVVAMIARSLGPIQSMILRIGQVDTAAGCGVINKTTKCLWTKDRRRIVLSVSFGLFIGSVSEQPDPACPIP